MKASTSVDAYAHVGVPRFGTAQQARAFLTSSGIGRQVFVLGPQVPDIEQIFWAHENLGDSVRVFGIPFGGEASQVEELAQLQIAAGVLGLRMEPREVIAWPGVLRLLGEAGRWVYATNPSRSEPACRALHEWLESYSEVCVGAPHFLSTRLPPRRSSQRRALERLAAHPRFFAILSRHGGMGSTQPYPHEDFREWVRFVLDLCGLDRVLFGSEYPVFFWRSERIEECLGWLHALLPGLTAAELDRFLGGNAQRLIFSSPPPSRSRQPIPSWVEAQFDRGRVVPLFPQGFPLPMPIYKPLLDRFLAAVAVQPRLTFEEFLRSVLAGADGP